MNRGITIKEDKSDLTIYQPLSTGIYPPMRRDNIPDGIGIAVCSIDPGIVNYAMRVESRYNDGRIEVNLFENKNFTDTNEEKEENTCAKLSPKVLDDIQNYLISKVELLSYCRIIIIERQQIKFNLPSIRVYQHTITTLLMFQKLKYFKYNDIMICGINPKVRGRELDGPKKASYYELKQWSIKKAI